MTKATRAMSINAEAGLHDALRRHAFERNVSLNKLVNDILSLWVLAATDRTDPLFSPRSLPFPLPEMPTGPYPEYVESLVFTVDE